MLWQCLLTDGVLADARNNFNIDNGITIVQKNDQYTDLFLFATTPDNYQINNFYLNNIDIINHFIGFYFEKSQQIIKQCKLDIPITIDHSDDDKTEPIVQYDKKLILDFFNETTVKDELTYQNSNLKILNNELIKLTNNKQLQLSTREMQTFVYTCKGMTMKEIANKLNLSPRTIEMHINRIKSKLNIHSKSEFKILFYKTVIGKKIIGKF